MTGRSTRDKSVLISGKGKLNKMDLTLTATTNSVEQKTEANGGQTSGNKAIIDAQLQQINGDDGAVENLGNGLDNQSVDISTLEQRSRNPESFLWSELIQSHFGGKALAIMDSLMALGRLSASQLRDKNPNFTLKEVKLILVSLLQLRLVKSVDDTSLGKRKITYYLHDEEGLYILLYSGLILNEINEKFPNASSKEEITNDQASAATIVENIIAVGSLSLKDYLTSCGSQAPKHDIIATFVKLIESGYLIPINKLNYTPLNDLWNLIYEKEYKLIPRNSPMSDLKKRNEAKGKAKLQFLDLIGNVNDLTKTIMVDPKTSLKTVKPLIPLTFNLERFLKSRRSKQLIKFAKSRLGGMSAIVYKTALAITEQKSPNVVNPMFKTGLLQDLDEAESFREESILEEEKTSGLSFSALDISKHLPKDIDLRGSLVALHNRDKNNNNKRSNPSSDSENIKKKIKTEDGFVIPALPKHITDKIQDEDVEENVEEEEQEDDAMMDLDFDEDDTDPRSITYIQGHLKLLAKSSMPFLQESKPGVYHIPYTKLMESLRSTNYNYLIASTLGPSAMRICRCIAANKLVSEKVINSTALMKEKDIRSTISSLIKYNVVEIQEVPRTVDRSAARAVFLFRIKEKHSYAFMRQNLEWNIANLLHKKETLKENNATLLMKANREDVKGREAELLLPSELNQLKMIKERELNAYVRISRVISLWEIFNFI